MQVLYGERSVFAREPQPAAVEGFTTDDLRAYHGMWERPDNAVLGICGDFHTDRMIELVTRELGNWAPAPGQPAVPPPVPNSAPPSPAAPPQILLLDKPGATQASVVMGELGTTLADPDVYSLDALNECASLPNGRRASCLVHCPLSTLQISSPYTDNLCASHRLMPPERALKGSSRPSRPNRHALVAGFLPWYGGMLSWVPLRCVSFASCDTRLHCGCTLKMKTSLGTHDPQGNERLQRPAIQQGPIARRLGVFRVWRLRRRVGPPGHVCGIGADLRAGQIRARGDGRAGRCRAGAATGGGAAARQGQSAQQLRVQLRQQVHPTASPSRDLNAGCQT